MCGHPLRGRHLPRVAGRCHRHGSAGRGDDGGFSLIEVVVAMLIFGIFAAAVAGILLRTTDLSRTNTRRGAATNLALQQIEVARATSVTDIPDGRTTRTATVGGTTYTVTQVAKYVSSGAETSACKTAGDLAYKLVTVTVSWPNMGSVKPVRSDTLKAVGIGNDVSDASKGSLTVAVTGAGASDQDGITVTLAPGGRSLTTADDGCVVFTGLAPGAYTASVSQAGYVGTTNVQAVTVNSLGVTAGAVAHGTIYYDTARTLNIAFSGTPGAAVLTGMPFRLGNSYQTEFTFPTCAATPVIGCVTGTAPYQAKMLYPEQYSVKVGACSELAPSTANVNLTPDTSDFSTVTVPVATPKIVVQTTGGVPVVGRAVTIAHTVGCSETYTVNSVSGGSSVVLPFGTWKFTTANLASPPTVFYSPSSGNLTATVTLTVSS